MGAPKSTSSRVSTATAAAIIGVTYERVRQLSKAGLLERASDNTLDHAAVQAFAAQRRNKAVERAKALLKTARIRLASIQHCGTCEDPPEDGDAL